MPTFIDELAVRIGFQLSPGFRRTLQQMQRGLSEVDANVKQMAQQMGLSTSRAADHVDDMSREARRDLERTGRAADELADDVGGMARDVDRATERAERSFDDMASTAQKTGRQVAGAFAGIGGALAVKSAAEFRAELSRIERQLTNLTFEEVERAVLGISSAYGVNRHIVAELASQIDNELAPTVQAFETNLARSVGLQKAVGLEDIRHVQRLVNVVHDIVPEAEHALAFDQLTLALQRMPLVREELDGLATGLRQSESATVSFRDALALLMTGRFTSQEVAGGVVEDLWRELDEFKRQGGIIDLDYLISGTGALPDTFTDSPKLYINSIRDMEDGQARFIQAGADLDNASGTNAQALERQREATGGLIGTLVQLQNFMHQAAGGLLDLLGGFAGLLPAGGGGAIALQAFGLDLSGAGRALRGFARFLAHPIASLQRFIAWLKASRLALLLQRGALGALRVAANLLSIAWWRQNVPLAILWLQLKRLTIQSWLANAGQLALRAGMLIGAVATGIATGATWALNTAMLANPIGLIIAAIAGLVVGFTFLVLKVDAVRNVFVAVWNWIKGNWPLLASILLGPFGVVAAVVWKFRDQIMGFLMGIFNWLKATPIFGPLIDWVSDAIGWVKTLFGWIGKIGEAFGWVKGAIGFGGPDDTTPAGQTARTVMDGFAAGAGALPTAPSAAATVANSVNRSVTVEVGEITINAPGADSREIAARVREQIREELRDLVISMDSAVAR